MLILCFGYFTVVSALQLVRPRAHLDYSTLATVGAIIVELLLMFAAVWVLRVRGHDVRSLGFELSGRAVLGGVPLFIASNLAYWLTWVVVLYVYPAAENLAVPSMTWSAPGWLTAIFLVINSVFEETAVTGYVVSRLAPQGAALALTASALIRFLYHLYQGPIASISILPLGFLFAAVYWRWRNLWPLIVAHTIMNTMSVMSMADA